jgi:hypothetical protein
MFDGAQGILFTPTLKQEDVLEETWKHMLKGDTFVLIPWTTKLNKALSSLPTPLLDFLRGRVFGVYHSMDEFTGHDK